MKKYILPLIAGIVVIAAIAVVLFVPDEREAVVETAPNTSLETASEAVPELSSPTVSEQGVHLLNAVFNEEGNLEIHKEDLSADTLSVIRLGDDSKIELVAVLDSNGEIQYALGTCQSCNGSPRAYYTQNGDMLQCNNCGLTFDLSIIGTDGSGCHPIGVNDLTIARTDDIVTLSTENLRSYEPLFANLEAH
ncbi:MAG: DUF2318 domain-containing protein [Solobacterium sp.]|nr:DUF2318 domain-containing protein [Solobacterium sp.]